MSITTEISRIQQAKADIKSSIEAKGVTVPSAALIDDYSDYVDAIQTGGGGGTPIAVSKDVSDYTGGTIFDFLVQITDVNWPSGITSIVAYSFYKTGLTSVSIPEGVASIGNFAFYNCSDMTSVTFPSTIESIGGSSFASCGRLTSITIPASVTSISTYAFSNCTGLTSITVEATKPPKLENSNAFNNTNNCPIYVPANKVYTYKGASGWSSLSSRIQAIPSE